MTTPAELKARRKARLAHHKAQTAHFANPTPATWAAYREACRTYQSFFSVAKAAEAPRQSQG
jgi:hypothetical protein